MNKTTKYISMILFGSAAWMMCAVALPMNQVADTDGLMAKVSNLVIGQAYAEDDESKSDDKSKSDDDKSKDDESKSSESSSVSYDFSSDTLICVSRSSVETTLNISSESSDDSKSSDKDDSKSSDDDKSSDKDDGKSSANESDSLMAKVFSLVIGQAYAEDDEAKSDDESKSDDDDKSKDEGDSESSDSSSSAVTSSDIDALATCTALGQGGSEPGVWVPATAVGDSAALTAYVQEVVQVGGSTPSTPDSSLESYREIRGE